MNTPVRLPPGRGSVFTKPDATGSLSRSRATTGIVDVAACIAITPDRAMARTRSGRKVVNSAASLAKPVEVGPKEAVVRAWIEHADPPDLPCLLCLARERHKRETQRENEPDQPHA